LDVHNRYIITQVKSGVMMIDRQAAQERILFEKYQAAIAKKQGSSQQLLFPQVITLSPQDCNLALEILPDLHALGFDVSDFGNCSLMVQGVPAGLPDMKEQELLEGLLEQYKLNQSTLKLDRLENLARAMARRASQKATGRLGPAEITALIDKLFACEVPAYTPSGNKTLVMLELNQLAGFFS
jgi:DNA mismatch repair protein MutL